MANLKAELLKKKLKPVEGPIMDYSSPKLAGFLKQADIDEYQNNVLDVNTENWLDILQDLTFETSYCPITCEEASLFVTVYQRVYQNLDHNAICKVDWKDALTTAENQILLKMKMKLEEGLRPFVKDGFAFVKTSSRSPKDGPLCQESFGKLYHQMLTSFPEQDRKTENTKITALLQAGFHSLKVKDADQVMDMFFRSERIYQDMILALAVGERFRENFVIRKFVPIDIDLEFRGFVFASNLTALSQYNYLIFSSRLISIAEQVKSKITNFFKLQVKSRLSTFDFPANYIIDFAISDLGDVNERIWVIEINPYLETTDGALFSWQHERDLLEGKEGFQYRLTIRPKPGAKAMLPNRARELVQTD